MGLLRTETFSSIMDIDLNRDTRRRFRPTVGLRTGAIPQAGEYQHGNVGINSYDFLKQVLYAALRSRGLLRSACCPWVSHDPHQPR